MSLCHRALLFLLFPKAFLSDVNSCAGWKGEVSPLIWLFSYHGRAAENVGWRPFLIVILLQELQGAVYHCLTSLSPSRALLCGVLQMPSRGSANYSCPGLDTPRGGVPSSLSLALWQRQDLPAAPWQLCPVPDLHDLPSPLTEAIGIKKC